MVRDFSTETLNTRDHLTGNKKCRFRFIGEYSSFIHRWRLMAPLCSWYKASWSPWWLPTPVEKLRC